MNSWIQNVKNDIAFVKWELVAGHQRGYWRTLLVSSFIIGMYLRDCL